MSIVVDLSSSQVNPVALLRQTPKEILSSGGCLMDVVVRKHLKRKGFGTLHPESYPVMVNHEPSDMVMLLLRGCRSYITSQRLKEVAISSRYGITKGRGYNTGESEMLARLSGLGLMRIKDRSDLYYGTKIIPQRREPLAFATTPNGYDLLAKFAKRKSFRPFFEAYAGHITETKAKAYRLTFKMSDETQQPPWLLGKDGKMQ